MDRLFTYGTLRPSLYPQKMLNKIGVKALIYGFKMYNLGEFPCLIESLAPSLAPIVGEVIALHSVTAYDAYEGYPHLYNRTLVNAFIGDLAVKDIWVYYMKPEVFDQHTQAVSVPTGDWADVLKALRRI